MNIDTALAMMTDGELTTMIKEEAARVVTALVEMDSTKWHPRLRKAFLQECARELGEQAAKLS